MNLKYFLTAVGLAGLTACSSVYKAGQTPDDVYFSPAKGGESLARADRQQGNDEGYRNYFEDDNARTEDRYLRMKARDRSRWAEFDDYYYNDFYGFGSPYSFGWYGGLTPMWGLGMGYYPGSWGMGYPGMWNNGWGWSMGWSSPWNGYGYPGLNLGFGNSWGWGHSFWGPGYYHSYFPYYSGGVIGKPGDGNYTPPAMNRPRPFNPRAYMSTSTNSTNGNRYQVNPAATRNTNRVFNNSNTRTNSTSGFQNGTRNTGGFNTGTNSGSNSGGYSPVRNETPQRTYNPGSSGSGSSGSGSRGAGTARPTRN